MPRAPSLWTKYLLALKLPHAVTLSEEVSPTRSRSLKNSPSPECITRYCGACRNHMQALYPTAEQMGFVGKNAQIMTFCFSLASSFYFGAVIVLLSCFVFKQQFLGHRDPWV